VFDHNVTLCLGFLPQGYSFGLQTLHRAISGRGGPPDRLVVFYFTSSPFLYRSFPFLTHMSSVLTLRVFGHSPSLHLPRDLATRVSWPLKQYLRILYLFTRSDLKTIVLPVVCSPRLFSSIHD
jgi:hypothetical protein